ncbi:MAG: RHS repeat-associated core domain-containing protein, partial [Lachnospiraceae bacterium]
MLEKEGDTDNDFLYTGEQYNANTGLYYLRARYMNPSTGIFISMDSYQGSIYDPVTLHKYLYANANPVMYTDPSGYMSLPECTIVTCIQNTINYVHQIRSLTKIIKWANAMCTVYDTAMEIRNVILGGGSIVDVIGALLKGVIVGFMVEKMCKTPLGIILKPMMAIFGLGNQVDQIQEAIKSGDPVEITVRFVQL